MRDFSMISPLVWRSQRFMCLSDTSKLMFLYAITSPHVNSTGCYTLHDGYACADLGWQPEDYRQARDEVIQAGMIDFDETTNEVLIDRWFKHNAPSNDKHAKGTSRFLAKISSIRLREIAMKEFNDVNEKRIEASTRKKAEEFAKEQRTAAENTVMAMPANIRAGIGKL